MNKLQRIRENEKTGDKAGIEMSPNTVSKWCTNQMQPTIETLFRIANVLDVEARDLLVNSKK